MDGVVDPASTLMLDYILQSHDEFMSPNILDSSEDQHQKSLNLKDLENVHFNFYLLLINSVQILHPSFLF